MSYQVIARKWRPQTFEEVTGQEHITQTLRNALEYDRLHHAYLFSGARGVGKTTTARLLAKALNCHKTDKPNLHPCSTNDANACPSCIEISESRSMDVLEIDAASHTGIDDVRDTIIENITVNPARDRYKVFIIDEVHQLSKSAFNALLKTLEEPPETVVFVMATTELHKVPETITSRCQQFVFRTIPQQKIFDRLRLIANAEKITVTDAALREIARSGEGSMRDAQSNFDQVISYSGESIDVKDVASALGIASREMLTEVITAISQSQPKVVLDVVENLSSQGQDLRNFCRDLLSLIRDLLVFKIAGESETLIESSMLDKEQMTTLSSAFSEADLLRFFNSLAETETQLKDATQPRYMVETGLVRLVEMRSIATVENILERLAKLEQAYSTPDEPLVKTATAEKKTLNPEPLEFVQKRASVAAPLSDDIPEYTDAEWQEPAVPEPEVPKSKIDLSFVDSLPTRLPPIAAEDLEHFEDERLDSAFERRLEWAGDDLAPIPNAAMLVSTVIGNTALAAGAGSSNGSVSVSTAAVYEPPRAEDIEPVDLPELSDNPTDDELIAYANAHPSVRKLIRTFHAKVVEVKKISD